MWEELARAIARPDLLGDPRFATVVRRQENAEALDREIQDWMGTRSTEEIVSTMERHSIPCGPVLDIPTLVKDPQFRANRTVVEVEYPPLGRIPVLAPPIRMHGDGGPSRGRPPRLGEHTREVLAEWLALTPPEIEALRAAGAL
jgi:crotonobetainyl-CoA:carnitine CoA-transferase CaiB-like acyl-CoA transferase